MRFATRTREIPKNLARVFSNIAHSSLKMIKSWGGGGRRKNIASKKGIFRLGTKDWKDRRVVFERRIFSFLFCFFFLGKGEGGKDFVLVSNYYIR